MIKNKAQIDKEAEQQLKILISKTESVISKDELKNKLARSIESGAPLKIKLGIDPTGNELHIGHAIPLRKLKQFQDLGHEIILIIGTFTAKIGDPSGKNETRKMMTDEEVQTNIEKYLEQIGKILDLKKVKIMYNADWLSQVTLKEIIKILSCFTVSQMICREDFANRLKQNTPVSLVELLYPVLQAYDSVAINADVELGGTDQTFNLLRGRDLQKYFGKEPQICMTFPILEGTSGVQKMSKSLNNYISLLDTSTDMFGKVMSIPDNLIPNYFRLAAYADEDKVKSVEISLNEKAINPMLLKKELAFEITKLYFNEEIAKKEKEYFETLFSKKEIPDDLPELTLSKDKLIPIELIFETLQLTKSKSEARRLLDAGAVKLNDIQIKDEAGIDFKTGDIFKVGKKNIFRLKKG